MGAIRVLFRYDTEEFTLRSCDEVTRRIAETLRDVGFTGTFVTVGELARVWERIGCRDVIDAVAAHDIGYHTNVHSVHPMPPAYCERKSWSEAIGEVIAREDSGRRDLERVMGRCPSCFTQAGAAWTPAFLGALRTWGIPVFWAARARHSYITLDEKPFWLSGVLNFTAGASAPRRNHLCLSERKGGVATALSDFREAADRLGPDGGLISISSHPWNLITTKPADLLNFGYGNNFPREAWRDPPLKSERTVEANFKAFRDFAEAVYAEPGVKDCCAREIPGLYPDHARGAEFDRNALRTIADALSESITFIPAPGCPKGTYLTPAEAVVLLSGLVFDFVEDRGVCPQRLTRSPCGPTRRVESRQGGEDLIERKRALRAAVQIYEYLSRYDRLPSSVKLGGATLSPADYTATLCGMARSLLDGGLSDQVEMRTAEFLLEEYDTSANVDWAWPIFPVGFDAPSGRELARLQTWSLKPACRS